VVLEPQEILALYASPAEMDKGEHVTLGSMQSQNQNIFLVVETTCPLSKASPGDSGVVDHANAVPPLIIEVDQNQAEEEHHGQRHNKDLEASAIPDWLMNELGESEDRNSVASDERRRHSPQPKSVLKKRLTSSAGQNGSQQREYQRKVQLQFDAKQKEIRLEAEHAVREREKALNEEVVRLREELERQQTKQEEKDVEEKGGGGGRKGEKSAACSIQ